MNCCYSLLQSRQPPRCFSDVSRHEVLAVGVGRRRRRRRGYYCHYNTWLSTNVREDFAWNNKYKEDTETGELCAGGTVNFYCRRKSSRVRKGVLGDCGGGYVEKWVLVFTPISAVKQTTAPQQTNFSLDKVCCLLTLKWTKPVCLTSAA